MNRSFIAIFLGVLLAVTPAAAITVQNIVGMAGNGPVVLGPGTISGLCQIPGTCIDMWDVMPSEGDGVFYGDNMISTALTTCRKTVDFGLTWNPCPTAYPVTGVFRELDITGNGSILSMRFEAGGLGRCVIDKSTDGGNSWTAVTVVTGANLQCNYVVSTTIIREQLRCIDNVCLALVNNAATGFSRIYRSNDNGDTWTLVFTSTAGRYAGIYFDGTNGFASTADVIFGQAWSTDDGFSWTEQLSASIVNRLCGPGAFATITGLTEGVVFPCSDSGLTQLRMNEFTFAATVLAVTMPTHAFSGVSTNSFMQRSVGRLYMGMVGSPRGIWYSADGGVSWFDITTSVVSSITQVFMFRLIGADLYFSYAIGGQGIFARISGG